MQRERSAPPGPAIYEDIVVATATQVTQTYLKRRAAKEASQRPSSMLELSMPKVMTGVPPATKGAGGTISPQASSSACATHSSFPTATSGRTPGLPTQSSKPCSLLQPQAVHIQSRPSHDNRSCCNERPKMAPLLREASYMPTTLTHEVVTFLGPPPTPFLTIGEGLAPLKPPLATGSPKPLELSGLSCNKGEILPPFLSLSATTCWLPPKVLQWSNKSVLCQHAPPLQVYDPGGPMAQHIIFWWTVTWSQCLTLGTLSPLPYPR